MPTSKAGKNGFSVLELIIVVTIVLIVVSIVISKGPHSLKPPASKLPFAHWGNTTISRPHFSLVCNDGGKVVGSIEELTTWWAKTDGDREGFGLYAEYADEASAQRAVEERVKDKKLCASSD